MNISTPETAGLSSDRLTQVKALTTSYIEKGKLAGAVSLIARRGKIVYLDCQGKASLESGQDMTEETIFRIYSMTKPITATAIMLLLERGHFQLSTPISRFLPDFTRMEVFLSGTDDAYKTEKAKREITFADLLTHTSGLTYHFLESSPLSQLYIKNGLNNFGSDETAGSFVSRLATLPLLFSPGEYWNYGLSYDVLGHLIEVISGTPLDEFLKREIFEPLGMVDTDYYVSEAARDRLAVQYIKRSGVSAAFREEHPDKNLFVYDESYYGTYTKKPKLLLGGGGLVSTITDYYKFCTLFLNKGHYTSGVLLSPKSVDLMTSNFLRSDIRSSSFNDVSQLVPSGYGYGLGFAIMLDPAQAQMLGTAGEYAWSGAAHTSFFIDPREELIGIFMTQVFPFGIYNIGNQFKQAVYQSIIT